MMRTSEFGVPCVEPLETRRLLSVSIPAAVLGGGRAAGSAPSIHAFALTAPQVHVGNDGGNHSIPSGTTFPVDLGYGILGQTSAADNSSDGLVIFNFGTVPFTVSNLSVPAGFTTDLPSLSQISNSSSEAFRIALDTSTEGDKAGTFSFTVSGTGLQSTVYSFPVHGIVVGSTPSATLSWNNVEFVDPGTGQRPVGTLAFKPTIDNTAHEILTPGNTVYQMHLPFALNNVQLGFNATLSGNAGNAGIYFYRDANANHKLDLAEKSQPLASIQYTDPTGSGLSQNSTTSPSAGAMAGGDYFVEVNTLAANFGNLNTLTTQYTLTASATNAGTPAIGVTAADGVSAANGSFGAVNQNAAATRTFTVKNTGTSTLHFSSTPSVTVPAGFSLVSDLPASLTPGQSVTFTIALSTSTTGAKVGTLQIASDAGGSPYALALSGTVGAPSSTTGTVAGVAFTDKNGNGAKEKKDAPLAGMTITLQPTKKGKAVGRAATTKTDGSGHYAFSKVAAGSYKLSETPPRGNGITTPVSGSYAFALAGGQSLASENFGNLKGFKPAVSVTATPFLAATAPHSAPLAADDGSTLLFAKSEKAGIFAE